MTTLPPAVRTRRSFLQQAGAALALHPLAALTPHPLAALTLRPLALLAQSSAIESALVTTPSGKLRGETIEGVRIFRGIPFAAPPVGPLRFRPPAPAKPWRGVRDATTFAPAAPQPQEKGVPQSEDCLYLNIWAPTGPGPFPVFVWIHGGGYTGGRAFDAISDGTRFAREKIIIVTVPYRLGVFGFMDLEPLLGPAYRDSGNNGLRDLTASLEWVHRNIASFGGDPARVTVGGESAGAKATAALMALPQASGLFHSAISESGGGERILTLAQAAEVSQQYGTLWRRQHPGSAGADAFNDLLTAPPSDLISNQTDLIATSTRHFPFRSEAGGSYLPRRPVDLVAAASFTGKRLLIGSNRDESASFIGPHPAHDPGSRDLGNLDVDAFTRVFTSYKTIYPQMTDEQLRIRAVTAEEYWVPSVRLADAHTRAGGSTWMYRLDYAKPSGPFNGKAYHGLDLSLIWQKLDAIEQTDHAAAQLSLQMHGAWVAFIKGEPPAAPGLPQWPAYQPESRATMIFSPESRVEERPSNAELQLWNGVL